MSFLTEEIPAEALQAQARTMPAAAMTQRGGAQVVFVVEDHLARVRNVTLGPRARENCELVQGAFAGDARGAEPAGGALGWKPDEGGHAVTTAVEETDTKEALVDLRGVVKSFSRGGETLTVLDGLNLTIPSGEFVALMGPSGSGKSTLLNLIAGIDRPTSGKVNVAGNELGGMSDGALAAFRARHLGFIFQSYNLMPVLTAAENVELPLLLTSLSKDERRKRALIALRVVGLEDRTGHYPRQLSGGQEQRVAIARAIVNDPTILVADEPTGDLDRKSADAILDLLVKLNTEFKKTIVMVTHDPAAAERATRVQRMDKGTLQ
ncbi:MAG: ABC transporter ATP-binding protein [Polyangiales bacterium]